MNKGYGNLVQRVPLQWQLFVLQNMPWLFVTAPTPNINVHFGGTLPPLGVGEAARNGKEDSKSCNTKQKSLKNHKQDMT